MFIYVNLLLQIPLSSSLLLVLNEDGMILNYRIVPNDRRDLVQDVIRQIQRTEGREKDCEAVYTDNPRADRNYIQETYKECFPDAPLQLPVLLDIYHGRVRILKEMNKQHPDYRAGKSDLSTIFAKLQTPGAFGTPNDLAKEFMKWAAKYSVVYSSLTLSFDDQLEFLAQGSQRYS